MARHALLLLVFIAYAATTFIVPVMAPVAISDDWIYAQVVQTLLTEHVLKIPDVSVTTLVFQVVWGALFCSLFGFSYGVLRISSLVLVALGALALYGLCREVGVKRNWAALGSAVYLFNPLTFVLSYTFMTDQQFAALLIISTLFYVRGLHHDMISVPYILLGSLVASFAFLIRQQGILIPAGVITYLILSRRFTLRRSGLSVLASALVVPSITVILYYLWLEFVNGVPYWQKGYLDNVLSSSVSESVQFISRLPIIQLTYIGLALLPISCAALFALPQVLRTTSRMGRRVTLLVALYVVPMFVLMTKQGWVMPYSPHFLTREGIGPNDLIVNRSVLFDGTTFLLISAVCLVSILLLIVISCSNLASHPGQVNTAAPNQDQASELIQDTRPNPAKSGAGLILAIGVWQAVGIIPPSYSFRNWVVDGVPILSLDRYLLPAIVLVPVLVLWSLGRKQLPAAAAVSAWIVIAAIAVFAVIGTRDSLVLQQTTWGLGNYADSIGISNLNLDAGAAWDGEHLYNYSVAHPGPIRTPNASWWIGLWAPTTDSSYVVTCAPMEGYEVVKQVRYSSWSHSGPQYLYLLHKSSLTLSVRDTAPLP